MKHIRSVLLLGSGALKIGEAGEFDYSGSQAIKALKEEGKRVILVNPNVATIQTSEGLADEVYFLPVRPEYVEQVIEKEKPDGILLSFGGQTALNCGLALAQFGVLEKYHVEVLGTPIAAIDETEDREKFRRMLEGIGLQSANGKIVNNIDDGLSYAKTLGYPVMLRVGFALGGTGSGIAQTEAELHTLLTKSLATTSQIIIEECLLGWKEIEYEVVRDRNDNCITVCNMENFDPVGIHTGESIVVAPSQTLTNDEYFRLRMHAIHTIRKLGIIGECNIQFALHPKSGDLRVIEVNARLSRSSALASKATGYPLAYVAAKLSLGKTLDEIPNAVTGKTTAFFEPALDYLVVKIPRWDLSKFTHVAPTIGSEMKSVGEVMAIGRSFEEAVQKAVRMLNQGHEGVVNGNGDGLDDAGLILKLENADPERLFTICEALKRGLTVEKLQTLTMIDPWFLNKLKNIVEGYKGLGKRQKGKGISINELLRKSKQLGFSDTQIGTVWGKTEEEIRTMRKKMGIVPSIKHIDTTAGEFPAVTNYLYMTYLGRKSDHVPAKTENKAIVIGGGPYAIGTSVEFDWCAVNTVSSLRKNGYKAIVVNCNPETVSTDYDISDVLYFEELTLERILDITDSEKAPVIVSVGGQIPNNLAMPLKTAGVPVLGTDPEDVNRAEDRKTFSALCDTLGILQPEWDQVLGKESAFTFASNVGYPVLVRPSYVLSGSAMSVIETPEQFEEYFGSFDGTSMKLVVSKFMSGAREYDVDAVFDGGDPVVSAISEHVEYGGVHSGDATMILPPVHLDHDHAQNILTIAGKIGQVLNISGLCNIQFLVRGDDIRVIEANVRASRSIPFVSKVTGVNFMSIAAEILVGKHPEKPQNRQRGYVGVKVPQFSYHKLRGSDPVLTVEMNSTGEVVGLGRTVEESYLKAIQATGYAFPSKKTVYLSLGGSDAKLGFLRSAKELFSAGFTVYASTGTGFFLRDHGIDAITVRKIYEGGHPNIIDLMVEKKIDFAVVTPENAYESKRGKLAKTFTDGYTMRRMAVDLGIPIFTNSETAKLFIRSVLKYSPHTVGIQSWKEYLC